jgi:Zn-dependent protease
MQTAQAATVRGDLPGARLAWESMLPLLPRDSSQYTTVQQTIGSLAAQIAQSRAFQRSSTDSSGAKKKGLGALGALGALIAKFWGPVLVFFSKAKFLLFGLAKIKTLFSMILFFGVYWSMYGWKFALGFVLSIYIHEMGHVAALARYGIPASAPMFVPFFGAFVRLHAYPANPGEDARVGLAGPLWGLGAAVAALGMFALTGEPFWAAIARTGAWINLFNLLPVWQLDGGRGFRALTRVHRAIIIAVALVLFVLTHEFLLILIAGGAVYRLFTHDAPEEEDRGALGMFAGLLAALSLVYLFSASPIHMQYL